MGWGIEPWPFFNIFAQERKGKKMFVVIKTQNDNIEYLELFESIKSAYGEFRRLLKEILAQEKVKRDDRLKIIKQAWINKEYKTLKVIYRPPVEIKDRKIYYKGNTYSMKEYIETVLNKNHKLYQRLARNRKLNLWEYLISRGIIDRYGRARF